LRKNLNCLPVASIDPIPIARAFAAALDRSEFAEAESYLSPGCRYRIGAQELVGREAIIGSYRESDEWGRRALDQLIYESEVARQGDDISVLYLDRIIHHGRVHEYRCRQHLIFNEDGQIARILHEELPGEKERLNEFFASVGVSR
jgi:hypothetical protein